MENAGRRERGATLLETAITLGILAVLFGGLAGVLTMQANVTGQTADTFNVFLAAETALQRIRDELKSAVQAPAGLTALPVYAVSATSITFRPPERFIRSTDPSYAALKSAGRISNNGILYAEYAKTISYNATDKTVNLTISGTPPPGMKTSEILAGQESKVRTGVGDVVSFAFFDGESKANPPVAPTDASYVIGIRIVVQRPSSAPGAKGADVWSSPVPAIDPDPAVRDRRALTAKVLLQPEALANTPNKPLVGP